MKLSVVVLCGFLLSAILADAQSKTDAAQVLSTAEITKIDAKKKSLQVREVVEPPAQQGRGGGGRRVPGGGGGGGGGRRRNGGGGYPGGGRYPSGGGTGGSATKSKEFKVFVLKDTEMTFAQAKIDFDQLHVGDRIAV